MTEPGTREARGPPHAGDDVRVVAAALADDPHGRTAPARRRPCRCRCPSARRSRRHLRAVPRAVFRGCRRRRKRELPGCEISAPASPSRQGRKHRRRGPRRRWPRLRHSPCRTPAAGGPRRLPPAGPDLRARAGVDDGDHDLRAAGRRCPGLLDVQRRQDLTRRRPQVPLPESRTIALHAGCVERGSRGAVTIRRRSSATAYSTSLSFARRSASAADVTPAANTTCDRSDTATPALIGSASRNPSATARADGTAVAATPASSEQRRVHPELHDHARHHGVIARGGALRPRRRRALPEKRDQEE